MTKECQKTKNIALSNSSRQYQLYDFYSKSKCAPHEQQHTIMLSNSQIDEHHRPSPLSPLDVPHKSLKKARENF